MSTCTQYTDTHTITHTIILRFLLIQKIKMLMDIFCEIQRCEICFATQNGNNILIDLLVKLSVNLVRTFKNPFASAVELPICCRFDRCDRAREKYLSPCDTRTQRTHNKMHSHSISHIHLSLFTRH